MDLPLERAAIDPTRETFKALFSRVPQEGPVVMLNLLAFREQAADGAQAPARTGRQAYAAYSEAVAPLLARVGASVQWLGDAHHALIGPPGEQWDEVLMVSYPSRDAFVAMIQSPEYKAIVHHRTAALRDARLIATTLRR
ncbi:DUF1330 domain-containing protein [Xenophilus arseniciresistens]|uniref:DUF1330 domain-containing protein n=1 Tax=Xenophilus arseniciresistens TaxID=1283306 RepID=A0AAE3T2D9_9BURK|nr:DUF1330 domain-containing protein [Xenophilus arseniciresistens]MDA7418267.1 DUF1330 domain-containing protein [Xenophilus arseniciresistens]